ncbi:MAG: MFS transporter [Leptospiraceae bacterium]|nr:MFS transporter [Leptospiraceae bacterium]MCB1321308.1 MFS transporter [Leptospiraceae bacterium]
MSISDNRNFRFLLFGALYLVQGTALAYFKNFLKPHLSGYEVDAASLGLLTAILLIPFILKIFLGLLSDRVNLFGLGYRKPYILIGLTLSGLALAGAGLVSPEQRFLLFSTLIVLASFGVTIFDSATDGMAIDVTPVQEHGLIQTVMVGSRAVGIIILSIVIGTIADHYGFEPVFYFMGAAMFIPVLIVLRLREPSERPPHQNFEWQSFRVMGRASVLFFILYAIVYSFVSFGVDGQITYYMEKAFDASGQTIGFFGAIRSGGAIFGALLAGPLLDRVGRHIGSYLAIPLLAIMALPLSFAADLDQLLMIGAFWGLAWGYQEAVFFALAMDVAEPRIAASMFAIMMAISNAGTAAAEAIMTPLTDVIGFAGVFRILAACSVLIFPVLWAFFRLRAKEITKADS